MLPDFYREFCIFSGWFNKILNLKKINKYSDGLQTVGDIFKYVSD